MLIGNITDSTFGVRRRNTTKAKKVDGGPIFPELREELEALFFSPMSEGRDFVINRYRDTSQNLRTTFGKIVHRAGLEMFPQPFRNLRKPCSNEVKRRFGEDLESTWIGHSYQVRSEHYDEVLDSDFQEAAEWTVLTDRVERPKLGEKSGKKTADFGFPVFLPAVRDGNDRKRAERKKRTSGGKP